MVLVCERINNVLGGLIMSKRLSVIICFVLVLGLTGSADAWTQIDEACYNLSFEYDINMAQIRCYTGGLDTVLGWNDNGVNWASVEIDCANSLGVEGCECKDDPATDGITKLTMGQWGTDSNLIVWQTLEGAADGNAIIRENCEYRVLFDTFKWQEADLRAYLFYGYIGDNTSLEADVNVITMIDVAAGTMYETFEVSFASEAGQAYIGEPLGVRFLQRGQGWYWIDNVRVEYESVPVDAGVPIAVENYSFEFDKAGAQIMCHTTIENVADWQTTGFGWSGVDPYCLGDVNYDPCATDENICGYCGGGEGCHCWAATHGICYSYVQASGMSLYQELGPGETNSVIAAGREYTLTFDAMSEIYSGSVDFIEIVPSLFYGEGENNHIEIASESYLLPVWIGEVNEWEHEWTRDLTVSWVSAGSHPSIGNALGVKFTVPSTGGPTRAYTFIDNVRLEYKPVAIEVGVDIKPGSCPNPVNVYSRSVLPVAILGSEDFDVTEIDAVSVRLNGVAAIRHSYEDVATAVGDASECECTTAGADGYLDLTLKFETGEIVDAVGEVNDGDVLALALTGVLLDERAIEGSDCLTVRGKHKPFNRADIDKNGVVNIVDFAIVSDNWLQSSLVEE